VVTGDVQGTAGDESDEAAAAAPTTVEGRRLDPLRARPILVFVHTDPNVCDGQCRGACQRYFDTDAEVFGDAKIGLGVRACRTVWITPEDASAEPLLTGTGDDLPRLVLLDVARDQSVVLQGKGLQAKRLYTQIRKLADRFYRERIDTIVKKHLKHLDAYDKLAQQESVIQERLTQTTNLDKIHDLEDDLDQVREERQELDRQVEDLWRLSLREL
jgi:hypothetical protein